MRETVLDLGATSDFNFSSKFVMSVHNETFSLRS